MSAAALVGLVLSIIFSEATGSYSNAGALLFFSLGLGVPVVYFIGSLVKRRWLESGIAAGLGFVSFVCLTIYILMAMGSGMKDF